MEAQRRLEDVYAQQSVALVELLKDRRFHKEVTELTKKRTGKEKKERSLLLDFVRNVCCALVFPVLVSVVLWMCRRKMFKY